MHSLFGVPVCRIRFHTDKTLLICFLGVQFANGGNHTRSVYTLCTHREMPGCLFHVLCEYFIYVLEELHHLLMQLPGTPADSTQPLLVTRKVCHNGGPKRTTRGRGTVDDVENSMVKDAMRPRQIWLLRY